MNTHKIIISGRLEFGNERSFEQVVKAFEHQVENYYKRDVMLKSEDIFFADEYCLNVPRAIMQVSMKSWRNTMNLLTHVAQFAIAGDLSSWVAENGKILRESHIEPQSDKTVVRAYLRGRDLILESGKESEAHEALSRAIEKFARHALAYERRGFVNFQLKNYVDAIYDYSKSIDINPNQAEPYFGRAFIYFLQEDYKQALADFEMAVKHFIALESMHWKSRRLKAECHLQLGEHELAAKELGFFTKRSFAPEDTNFKHLRRAFFLYGTALAATGLHIEAIRAYEAALKTEANPSNVAEADILLQRGISLKKIGKKGFLEDWKAAAKQGSKKAAQLLETA